jgi:glycosyltransferase involved in cell wall biosynthesis
MRDVGGAMKLSIVIPCFNERDSIIAVVEAVLRAPLDIAEIIIVDDGSTDGTADLLNRPDCDARVTVHRHARNLGKGAALRTGFAATSGDIVVVQDADLEYDPRDLPSLVQPIAEGRADVVYGSRFVGGRPHRTLYFRHRIANAALTAFSNLMTDFNLTDMETGYKAFRGDVARRLRIEEKGFGVEPEMTARISRMGCRVYEVGISYYGRTYAEGKKIRIRDGLRAVWCILLYRFRD